MKLLVHCQKARVHRGSKSCRRTCSSKIIEWEKRVPLLLLCPYFFDLEEAIMGDKPEFRSSYPSSSSVSASQK